MAQSAWFTYDEDSIKIARPFLAMKDTIPEPKLHDVQTHRVNFDRILSIVADRAPRLDVNIRHHKVRTRDNSEIRVVQVSPANPSPNGPAVLHSHGGGYISGSAQLVVDSGLVPSFVQATNVTFFSVDYRLAPESQYDGPVNDSYDALQWLSENAAELGIDNARLGVMGESAGGGISAGVALQARDRKLTPSLKKQILIYPMLDDRTSRLDVNIEDFIFWSYSSNTTAWSALLGRDVPGTDKVSQLVKYAVPARVQDLSGLPDTYLDCGQLDIFLEEDIDYVRRLHKAGVQVDFSIYKGLPHAWELLATDTPIGKRALAGRIAALHTI